MAFDSYPGLYYSADAASIVAQKTHFSLLFFNGFLLVTGAVLSLIFSESVFATWVGATVFLIASIVTILMMVKRYDAIWYQARALAESVKTTTWRYMMGAEPFHDAAEMNAESMLRMRLAEVLADNRSIAGHLSNDADGMQCTDEMRENRQLGLNEIKKLYREDRIQDQKSWYADKAKFNNVASNVFFLIAVFFQLAAAAFVVGELLLPEFRYWPVELFAILAGLTIAWIQAKRYTELSQSYALAAHEIGIIEMEIDEVTTKNKFVAFVAEAESAFSREHTQWAARQG